MPHKHVIIYLPNGSQVQYCTKELGDINIEVAATIECDLTIVNVVTTVDGKTQGRAYAGMPYILDMWD